MKITKSDRGLKYCEPFKCSKGSKILIHESSAAEEPHIFIHVDCDLNILNLDKGKSSLHLNFKQTQKLIKQLQYMMKHHYQIE